MARKPTAGSRSIPVITYLLLLAATLVAVGCGTSGGPSAAGDGGRDERASRLFAQLESAHSLEQDGRTLDLADQLLGLYPDYPRNDRTLAMAADAAVRRRDPDRALSYIDRLLGEHPDSPRAPAALEAGAGIAMIQADTLRAAGYLAESFARDPAEPADPALGDFRAPFASLSTEELESLAGEHRDDPAGPFLSYLVVERLVAVEAISTARAAVTDLADRAPDSAWTAAAQGLIGVGRSGRYLVAGPVVPTRIGIVCPLTGRYAVLGNALYEAALMALDATNAELGTSLELVPADSGGDPVTAALAGRRLAGPDGCVGVLGSLMSGPTAALAIVADQHGMPLVSPTATNDRIWELGEGIFQTNLTALFEVRLLARLATTVMLKRTFGILLPDTPEARRHAEVFRSQVEAHGGTVVVETDFPSTGTDFRRPILEVREARPEVIFTPSSVDQMIMLGPQLDFFRAGSLVMGLSNWNNPKLADRSKTVLERAIFPDDQALLPPEWTGEFDARWDSEAYPGEAAALALKAYQATRLLLDTLGRSGAKTRAELADALRLRMADQDVEASGPESFGALVHMFSDGQIVPFPAEIFTESWALVQAEADTIAPPKGTVAEEDDPFGGLAD